MNDRGSARPLAIALIGGTLVAVANVFLLHIVTDAGGEFDLKALYDRASVALLFFVISPVLLAALSAALGGGSREAATVSEPAATKPAAGPAPPPPSPAFALQLLTLLQQEGRFVDFLQEPIDGYSDEQVGAAVRSIHAGCRKALDGRIEFSRILADEDGSPVSINADFDRHAVRLTGNVTGEPPFRGTLQHGGWKATKVNLPQSSGDATIIAPAEVELP